MKRYEVLKVVFTLSTPILLNHPWIHFDGLLAHVIARRKLGDGYYTLPSKYPLTDVVTLDELPIAKICMSNVCFADVSVSMLDGKLPPYERLYIAHVRKRFTERYVHEVRARRRKVEVSKGPFKLFDIEYFYAPAKTVEFLVKGDEGEIAELVRLVYALGAKRAEGWGFVKSVRIEKTGLEHAFMLPDGTVTRPIPIDPFIDAKATIERHGHCDAMLSTFKPPYWDVSQARLCTMPGKRYVLRRGWAERA